MSLDQSKLLILGADGQLGSELRRQLPQADALDRGGLDITDRINLETYQWEKYKYVINAAAYTAVDAAETDEGREAAWLVNAQAPAWLARIATKNNLVLVHISTDYVFNGHRTPHSETEPLTPMSGYGTSKAAGDIAVSEHDKHYLVRTSWVMGAGKNFARTMIELARKGINPTVVSDQTGRPTFTNTLAAGIIHLLNSEQPYGTYNLSNGGDVVSWAQFAEAVFQTAGLSNTVTPTTSAEYFADKPQAAPRPAHSEFDLSKIEAAGFKPADWRDDLKIYLESEASGQ